jgi:serine/threonine-protein kinase RsbW
MRPVPRPKIPVQSLHIVLAANPDAVRDGLARMMALQPLAGLSGDDRGAAELVLAEILNNVAEHAYSDATGTVAVTLLPVPVGLDCLVVDQGVAMPDSQLPAGKLTTGPDTGVDDLPEGGFGWHLIRVLTRNLSYVREGDCNRLSFVLPNGGWAGAATSKTE